jgi:hypothetical protein
VAEVRALLLVVLTGCAAGPGTAPRLSVAPFVSDATPPIGHPLCGGWIKPVERVEAPLLVKGVVLSDGRTRYVVAAIDWCVLRTAARDAFLAEMAKAAGVPASQATIHCTHTHSAPIGDARAQELLDAAPNAPAHLDLKFLAEAAARAGAAVREAVTRLRPFTHVGTGKSKVEEFASNRRVPGPDGKILVRYSATRDPALRAAPEGLVDPWLRTISFYDGDTPVARLHFYASHPQSHYGDGTVSPDVPGQAREYLQSEEGVFQVYFTGCAGNVTAGKYNDGSPAARLRMSKQLYSGMIRSASSTKREAADALSWKTTVVSFPLRKEAAYSEEAFRTVLADAAAPAQKRLRAALALSWYERVKARPSVEVARLRLGSSDLLFLPGEAFVEYQLHAQERAPGRFVCVASYGEGGAGYLCTDAAFGEGGYEPTESYVGPPAESLLKAAIDELLR